MTNSTFLNLTIYPHRSLSRNGFIILMFIFGSICLIGGTIFWFLGAWPVFGFIGLDVWLLYYAFKINYRSGEIFETLKIEKEKFLITRNFPSGKQQSWNLEPYWASVELNSQKRNEENLILKSKDKIVLVGSFLNYNDKRKLFDRIQEAINTYKKK